MTAQTSALYTLSPRTVHKPLKPWKSFADQLAQLQARGLLVDDKPRALHDLRRIGYYRLSGYWYPMRCIDGGTSETQGQTVRSDDFLSGSQFGDVVRLYVFDKKLKLLALDALERIELAVRVDVAHTLGARDPMAHENPACLHGHFTKKTIGHGPTQGRTRHEVWLDKYQTLLRRARKQAFVQHHEMQYGQLPIWVAVEVWDFGLLSQLFAGMTHADQETVAKNYGFARGKAFAQCLRSLNFIRNVAAHHGRLWNLNVLERAAVPLGQTLSVDNARPYFYFCLMQQLLRVICPKSQWGRRFVQLLREEFPAPKNHVFSLADMGAPPDGHAHVLWQESVHK